MEWHTLTSGTVLYFMLDQLPAEEGGEYKASVCSGSAVLKTSSSADRSLALAWLASEREAKMPEHVCTLRCRRE